MTGLEIAELLGIEDVLAIMRQKGGDGRDDARTIRTGQGQNILMIGHGNVTGATW
jgi:hypothetical protein